MHKTLWGAVSFAVLVACASQRESAPNVVTKPADAALELAARDPSLHALLAPQEGAFTRDATDALDATDARLVNAGWRAAAAQLRFGVLGVRLPEHADGAVEVGVARFERLRLRVTLAGAASSPAQLDAGRVVYRAAFTDVDRVCAASEEAFEDALVIKNASAPHAFAWRIEIPADVREPVAEAEGLVFHDASGGALLRMPWAYALDARGTQHPVQLFWDAPSHELRASLSPARDLAYPVLLDPRFETGVWYTPSIFSYRQGPAVAFDAVRGNVVLFGGGGSSGSLSTSLSDTWIYDGTAWTQRYPAVSPGARFGASMAFDSVRGNVVLFGGFGGGGYFADTWTWNGATWTRAAVVGPTGRYRTSLAFDSARGEAVLFGGEGQTGNFHNDTWAWNGSTWNQRSPAGSPSVRAGAAFAFDSVRNTAVLFGGSNTGGNLGDTWTWNGTTWTQAAGTMPTSRTRAGLAFDAARGNTVLFGGSAAGDTWTWSGAAWTQRAPATSPAPRESHGMVYDAAHQRVYVVAGFSLVPGQPGSLRDTFGWDGTTWAPSAPITSPSARIGAAAAYDAARDNVVLFGGATTGGMFFRETWIWNGTSWAQRTPATQPPGMFLTALAFDAARSKVLLFGGSSGAGGRGETFTWDGTTWTQINPATSPPGRSGFAMAYDAARMQVVAFGGLDNADVQLGDTWTWNGTNWANVNPPTSPTPRAYHAMTYDGVNRNVVLYGGQTPTFVDDTWTFDGSTWTSRVSALTPGPRANMVFTFDTRRGTAILFGGIDGGANSFADTWFWNGSVWALGSTNAGPSARNLAAGAFDATRGTMIMHGGFASSGTAFSDTWLLYGLGGMCSSNADCPSASCVDGVCCNAPRCGTCETCAGASPGRCAPVQNQEDADSCPASNGQSCSATGACKVALGKPAASAVECASGFLVDGVCCDTACDGSCQACRDDLKASGQRSGVCDHARDGLDPHDSCASDDATTCQRDGTCDGRGKCRLYAVGTGCGAASCVDNRATGRLCNGFGTCGESADGVSCGLYACRPSVGCTSTCATNADCGARSHCEASQCVANEGASCDGDHTVFTPDDKATDCGKFKCAGATCKASCVSLLDCVSPAVCNAENKCVGDDIAPPDDGGGGCSCRTSKRAATPNVWAWLCALATLWSVRRRAHVGRSRRAQ